MIFGNTSGRRVTKQAVVGASPVTLHTATDKLNLALEGIAICNASGAARTFSVYVDTGAGNFYLYKDAALASAATLVLQDFPVTLTSGRMLKVVASGADVHATAVFFEMTPNQASEPQTPGLNRLSSLGGGT